MDYPLYNHTKFMPSGIQELSFPSFTELKAPPVSHISSEIDSIQSGIGSWPWWVWVMVIAGAGSGVLFLTYIGYKKWYKKVRLHCRKGEKEGLAEREPRRPVGPTSMLYPSLPVITPLPSTSAPMTPQPRAKKRIPIRTCGRDPNVKYKAHTGEAMVQVDLDPIMEE